MGSPISAADLAGCKALVRPALEAAWRGKRLFLANGLTAAPTLLRVLEGMRGADFSGAAPSPAWYAQLARVMRAAYAERLAGLGDAEPKAAESCTTHLTVCDKDGMMVAMTTTLLSSMGSRVVLPRSGVLMNNGIMWFDPRPEAKNALAPGKRPLTNMCPVIAAEGDTPVLAAGASGGRRIMAAVFQTLSYVADFGMTPEQAAHHPRLDVSAPEGVTADIRLGAATLAALGDGRAGDRGRARRPAGELRLPEPDPHRAGRNAPGHHRRHESLERRAGRVIRRTPALIPARALVRYPSIRV